MKDVGKDIVIYSSRTEGRTKSVHRSPFQLESGKECMYLEQAIREIYLQCSAEILGHEPGTKWAPRL